MKILSQILNGLSIGSIYALVALGYNMVYGIVKLINFAHGDIIEGPAHGHGLRPGLPLKDYANFFKISCFLNNK